MSKKIFMVAFFNFLIPALFARGISQKKILQPPVVTVIKGDIKEVKLKGEDITQDFKKMLAYGLDWNKGGFKGMPKNWTNSIFRTDPHKGKSKYCNAILFFANGSHARSFTKEDEIGFPWYPQPFQVIDAQYGRSNKPNVSIGKDVTWYFQQALAAKLDGGQINQQKSPAERARLNTIWQNIAREKNLDVRFDDEEMKSVTVQSLQAGWKIVASLTAPGMKRIEPTGKQPEWTAASWNGIQGERLEEKVWIYNDNAYFDKELKAANQLPTALQSIENQNELIEKEAAAATQGR